MRSNIIWAIAFLFAIAPSVKAAPTDRFAPQEFLVRFKNPQTLQSGTLGAASFSSLPSDVSQFLSTVRATELSPIQAFRGASFALSSLKSQQAFEPLTRTYLVKLAEGVDVLDAIAKAKKDSAVELAEPNYRMTLSAIPNDSAYSVQWLHKNTGQSGGKDGFDPASGTAGVDIDSEVAWEAQTGSNTTVIAVIDSGIDTSHPDLSGNLWTNSGEISNGIDDDGNSIVDDINGANVTNNTGSILDNCGLVQGHGTHVSGIVGAIGNNSTGVAGVGWDFEIMMLKVAQNDGLCSINTSDIIEAVSYAVAKGADVINMSLGGADSTSMQTAMTAARTAGVVLVAAAGNESTSSEVYPAAYSTVLGVAATDRKDNRASFSNYGNWVSLAAPGVGIYSTLPTSSGSYGYLSGTSMASPVVAGIAGLIKSAYPSLTVSQVEERIQDSCEIISATGIGYGRVNAARALLNLSSISPSSGPSGQTTTYTLAGAAFHSGMTARLTKTGSTPLSGTNLSIASHSQATVDFEVPIESSGVYTLELTIGSTTKTLENALTVYGLSISTATPTVWPAGATTGSVTVTGQNFASGISFYLAKSGESNIAGTNLVINSDTSATVEFDLTSAAAGRWDIVLSSGAFTTSLEKGLAVTNALYQVVTPSLSLASQFNVATGVGTITLDWPANATTSPINIDIDAAPTLPSMDSSRDPFTATGIGVGLEEVGATPTFQNSFQITLPFQLSSLADPTKLSALSIAYFNTTTSRWQPIDDIIVNFGARTVTGSANHFSHFQIVQHAPSINLDRVVSYPNPFRPDRGHDRIVFDFLTANAELKIFDLSGHLVRTLTDDDGDGRVDWIGVTNSDGENIASGIYYYLAVGQGMTKTGRLAVIR